MNLTTLTPETENTFLREILKVLIEKGSDGLNPVMATLLNEAMKIEREQHLNAKPYERSAERRGQANGFKSKTLLTRSGALELEIPQVRDSSFYPSALEKGSRSEVALKLSLAEMYIQGVSTRKVKAITEQLCGVEISSTHVSNVTKLLDESLEQFRMRPLGDQYPYVYLDAQYQRVRHNGMVRSLAVLMALGVSNAKGNEGRLEVLGVSVSLSEAEVHWRGFLQSLVERGLSGVKLIISDDHEGLGAARQAVLPAVPWQRCLFHMSQNAQSYAPKRSMREQIGQAMRDIFTASSREDAMAMTKKVIKRFEKSAPEFTEWLEENLEQGLTYYSYPRKHWKKIRTSKPP